MTPVLSAFIFCIPSTPPAASLVNRAHKAVGQSLLLAKGSEHSVMVANNTAARCADPEVAVVSRIQREDAIVTKRRRIGTVEHDELESVKTRQPSPRSNPKITVLCLCDGQDHFIRQAVLRIPNPAVKSPDAFIGGQREDRKRRENNQRKQAEASAAPLFEKTRNHKFGVCGSRALGQGAGQGAHRGSCEKMNAICRIVFKVFCIGPQARPRTGPMRNLIRKVFAAGAQHTTVSSWP